METADLLAELASDIQDGYSAVQTKGGTIPQNKNTNNLATAISTIPTGITPTGTINITQNGTVDVTNYASASVAVPNDDTELVALIDGTLMEIDNSAVNSLRNNCFRSLTTLRTANFPSVTRMGEQAFNGCTRMVKAFFPTLGTISGQSGFYGTTALNVCDIGFTSSITNNTFANSGIKNLVLRKTTLTIINYVTVFTATPFRNGTGGTAYVPYSLVSTYQSATNWSALESTTFASIQENLIALNALGVDITNYYEIVTELPTSDIATDKVYFIETQTSGTYEQWFYGSGSWVQLPNITLGGS